MRAHLATHFLRFPLSASMLLLLGLVALAEPGLAGTGRLVSSWMSRAPAIDGLIADGEWSEATAIDLGTGVTALVGNDGRTLYVRLIDARPGEPAADRMILFLDDDGGSAPVLDDGLWTSAACQATPALGEGEIWFEVAGAVDYYEWISTGPAYCPAQALGARQRSAIGLNPAVGVIYEVALPLDGPMPLHGAPGQRFGLQLRAVDGSGLGEVCYPSCSLDPSDFRNLILASGGCNRGPQDFGFGRPIIGLPLDWSSFTNGTGQAWNQSGNATIGSAAFCEVNVTGGANAGACVADALYSAGDTWALLSVPASLAGQTTAKMRLRASFEAGVAGASLHFGVRHQDATLDFPLTWSASHGGQPVEVDLPMTIGNLPSELAFYHLTDSSGIPGGYAQVDDVELLCGPVLFADGFESSLTTHWSATAP